MIPKAEMGIAPAISLQGVTKSFGSTCAVRDLDLCVPEGALYGFIGPNGAGKTTSLRMIMSILFPDRGAISVLGCRSALEAKDRIGYLPEERGVYRKMRVGAFLTYMARLKGVNDAQPSRRVRDWLDRVDLQNVYDKKCEELSKGMLQKVQLVAAMLHRPELLILDEPFSGLDPVNTRLLRELVLAEHRRGATILFSTHIMPQAEELCDHIVMLHLGRKVLDETLDSIRRRHDARAVFFEPFDPAADVAALRGVEGVAEVVKQAGGYRLDLIPAADPVRTMRAIALAVAPSRIELQRPSLEDIFVERVTGEIEPARLPA
jgi:ABC-2 type transport system ATP-binding protein